MQPYQLLKLTESNQEVPEGGRWALEVKVDSVDPFKTGKTGSCINFAAKLSDATGVVRCIGFHDAEVISRRFKVGGTYRIENANPKDVNPNFVRDDRFDHKCEIILPANDLIWCVVESGFPPQKVRKIEEKVDVLPSTSLMKESVESLNVFDLNDFEVVATSTNAEKILGSDAWSGNI
ncbi:hypothetical protein DAPPUDRAFT_254915 [Daphnia pulex]|uniref:OB domain-containing protein n=1 Tax=Daphnia pulex TaxID=6669 RepID=E9H868_DAPPU|nr:hypothetical protein DAPPUDRAFT_254915 [Daphnia pulex]|eukprot:EFX72021.1 hypothetical protein DAPPUDRAFT_254915 [Daphnia pulex]